MSFLRRSSALFERIVRIIVIFAVARIILGVVTIALFDRDAFTWSVELTIISAAAVAVYLVVALIVRRWTPSRAN